MSDSLEAVQGSGFQDAVERGGPVTWGFGRVSMTRPANRALMAAGLVDRIQVTLFPVITGQTGSDAIFKGAADFDLELIERRTLDRNIQELTYGPTLHV